MELVFSQKIPQDWPEAGSWQMTHFLPDLIPANGSVIDYWSARTDSGFVIRLHVFNGAPGGPTVVLYAGSSNGWDGLGNYNFIKECVSPPNAHLFDIRLQQGVIML